MREWRSCGLGSGTVDRQGRQELGESAGVDAYLPLIDRLHSPVGQSSGWGRFDEPVVRATQGDDVAEVARAADLPWRDVVHVAVPHRDRAPGIGAAAVAERDRQPKGRWYEPMCPAYVEDRGVRTENDGDQLRLTRQEAQLPGRHCCAIHQDPAVARATEQPLVRDDDHQLSGSGWDACASWLRRL